MSIDNRTLSRRTLLKSGTTLAAATALGGLPQAFAAEAPKPEKLTMLYATSEADSDAIKAALPAFKEAFGIDIALDTMPYNALQQKAFAELASESPYYDIMIVDTPWMPALTNKIMPITDMILNPAASEELDIADFIPKVFYDTAVYKRDNSALHFKNDAAIDVTAIKAGGFDVYGLPMQSNVLTMAYRKDLFEDPTLKAAYRTKFGRELVPPETWDDFAQVAEFMTDPAKRRWGTTMMAGAGDWATDDFKTLLAGFGGDGHLVSDTFEPVFNSPEGIRAMTYYAELIARKVVPPGTTSASWDSAATSFGSGLAAMSMNYHSETLNPTVKGEIAYAMVPKGVARGPHFGTWMLSVNGYSKNKDWAFRAIKWFTSRETQTKALAQQLHPTRLSVYAAAAKDPAITGKFGNFYDVLGQSLQVGVGRPRLTNYADIDRAVWVAVNNAARGSATPEAALKGAAGEVSKLLEQAGYKKS